MEHTLVKSSSLHSVAYNKKAEILEVAMKNGKLYRFSQVPATFWKELMIAKSIGKYFFNNIKDTFPSEFTTWK